MKFTVDKIWLSISKVVILLVFLSSLRVLSLLNHLSMMMNGPSHRIPISEMAETDGWSYSHHHWQQDRRVTTVFSTACSISQDWQSQVVVYNHYQMGIPGDLVRLMACEDRNYQLPNHTTHPNYRVVWTPDFDQVAINQGHVAYSPRNRPASMEYWLSGRSEDWQYPRGHRHIVLAIDPDQVFLTGRLNLSKVQPKHAIAAEYDLGTKFLGKWAHVCKLHNQTRSITKLSDLDRKKSTKHGTSNHNETRCHLWQKYQSNPSFGHPQAMTASDALEHSRVWYHMTNEIKAHGHNGWETEMFSNVFAGILVGIHFDVHQFMMSSHVASAAEPWKDLLGSSPLLKETTMATLPMWIGHYCQEYQVGDFSWSKNPLHRPYDIHSCENDPRDVFVKCPTVDEVQLMEKIRRFRLSNKNANSRTKKQREGAFRQVWMLDHVWTKVREALVAHYEAFC